MAKIDEEYERAYSSFVDLVMEIAQGSYGEKREKADELWEMANSFKQDYDNLAEDVRTAVEEIEDLCEGRKIILAEQVLSIVHAFLM